MFKCVECGTEYKIKPDYCDCGNDMFELVEDMPEIEMREDLSETKQYFPQQEEFHSSLNSNPLSFDTKSITIFALCILFAFLTLFFIGNPKQTPQAQQKKSTQTTEQNVQNIPSVDSFWDNSTEGINSDNVIAKNTTEIEVNKQNNQQTQHQQVKPTETVDPFTARFERWLNQPSRYEQNTVSQPIKSNTQTQKTTAQKTVQQNKTITVKTPSSTINTQTQQAKKQTQANNSQKDLIAKIQKQYSTQKTNAPQTTNNTQPKQTTQNITTIQKTTNSTQQKTAENSRPKDPMTDFFDKTQTTAKNSPTENKTITTHTTPKVVQKGKSQAQLQQELTTYKASLRNNIGRKINFAHIVGDGNCAITFNINSSGKLTNRKFSQQSTNITLNDAVYSAMMSTPSYNPPPEGYKNETLTFHVKIYNGNYEISLK